MTHERKGSYRMVSAFMQQSLPKNISVAKIDANLASNLESPLILNDLTKDSQGTVT